MIRNEDIQNKVRAASIVDKMREVRLRWFVHMKKRCTYALVRRCERLTAVVDRTSIRERSEMFRQDMPHLQLTKDITLDKKI